MDKKLIGAIMAFSLAGSLLFSGCSSKNQNTGEQTAEESMIQDVESEVTLGEYKGLPVTVEKLPDVTDDEVTDAVMAAVENASVTGEITDRAVASGDTVNVDYTGYMDGEEIPESSVEDYNILIGSGVFFNGAESSLIGVMPGETANISVTYPEGYPQEDLVGKNAVYQVTVNYIVSEEQAELTDEFVSQISDCQTVDEYRQMVREALETSRENEREQNRRNAVWDKVLENAQVVAYNSGEVQEIVDQYTSYDQSAARDFEMSLEDYVQTYQGVTMDEYTAAIEDIAKQEIKERLVIDAIAQAENINGDNATDEEIQKCSQQQGYDAVDAYKRDRGSDGMAEDVKGLRVVDFVVDSAQITEE